MLGLLNHLLIPLHQLRNVDLLSKKHHLRKEKQKVQRHLQEDPISSWEVFHKKFVAFLQYILLLA